MQISVVTASTNNFLMFLVSSDFLCQELIKQTPKNHPDFTHLQKAAEMISQTVGVINESKKTAEESETMFSIQQRITYPKKFSTKDHPVIAPGRKFQEKGSCTYISGAFKSSTVKWYLFNDLLILTNARNQLKKYVPTTSALLGHVTIEGKQNIFNRNLLTEAYRRASSCI